MQFESPKDIPDINYEIVIVGSGPAGLSIVNSLKKSNKKILILEAGFQDFDKRSQVFYEGTKSGYKHADLDLYRKRQLGGSSNCWGGACLPFDEIDFNLTYLKNKVWPISRNDLITYYEQAGEFYGIGNYFKIPKVPKVFVNDLKGISQSYFLVNESNKVFTKFYEEIFSKYLNIDLCLRANVFDIDFDNNARIRSLKIKDYDGKEKTISGENFILAAGGIESTRLLLNWSEKHNQFKYIKNNLGYYYSPHINIFTGRLIADPNKIKDIEYVSIGKDIIGKAYFSLQFDKNQQSTYLNSKWNIYLPNKLKNAVKEIITGDLSLESIFSSIKELSDKNDNLLINYLSKKNEKNKLYTMSAAFDQTPTRESRIQLIDEKDTLGLKKVNLNFHIEEEDISRIKNTYFEIARILGENGIGRMNIGKVDEFLNNNQIGRSHHTGTIRMAIDNSLGCVNNKLKVFGIDNLWVCSSAVFPRPSHANPTFTIMALANRLAEEFKS